MIISKTLDLNLLKDDLREFYVIVKYNGETYTLVFTILFHDEASKTITWLTMDIERTGTAKEIKDLIDFIQCNVNTQIRAAKESLLAEYAAFEKVFGGVE